jgi:ubiquinone/menaquinone biosynthesis C-methylase UbiE
MDDQTFDQQTALDWISSIETVGKNIRDEDIYPKLNAWLIHATPDAIIDIGCGQGVCSEKIDLKDRHYTGVEPSLFLLDRAKQLYSGNNINFITGNAYSLPLPDASADAAYSVLLWHLLSDLQTAARELSRVLKSNGHFLIITANPGAYGAWKDFYSDLNLMGKKLVGTMKMSERVSSHDVLYLHTFNEINDSLQGNGLQIQATEIFRPSKKFADQKMLTLIRGQKILDR